MRHSTFSSLEAVRAKVAKHWGTSVLVPDQEYLGSKIKMKFVCEFHGEFMRAPNVIGSKSSRCPSCGVGRGGATKIKPETQLAKLQVKFPNLTFPKFYSEYENSHSYITVVCPDHGAYSKSVHPMLTKGDGCWECGLIASGLKRRLDPSAVLNRFKATHGDTYDYSKAVIGHINEKIEIGCPTHGSFQQTPKSHFNGSGCPHCWSDAASDRLTRPYTTFIEKAEGVHGSRYTYKENTYQGLAEKITIVCSMHGEFEQKIGDHLRGSNCPLCAGIGSVGQRELLSFIVDDLGLDAVSDYVYGTSKRELDVYIPAYNIGFEFNGIFWHSSKMVPNNKHIQKQKECAEIGITMYHIFSDEWENRKEIVKSLIRSKLGLEIEQIGARQCKFVEVTDELARNFYSMYHIQGWKKQGANFGLVHGNTLLALMTFTQNLSYRGKVAGTGEWELARFASSVQVLGGFSKLLQHAQKKLNMSKITSYSDNRLFSGEVYARAGFRKVTVTRPSYTYIFGNKPEERLHKSLFRHSKLARKFGSKYDPTLTEKQNCENNGYYQIYDCGLTKWELTL